LDQAEAQHEEFIGTVLIADDDPDFRSLLVRRAKKMGLEVVEVEDGDQAINALEKKSFDVLVADLYMPGRTGLEVIHAAQRIDQELETIVLTGSASVETAIEALRAGVYDYLTKPLESLTVFEMTLTRALERRYLIRENERLFKEIQRLAVTDQLTGLFNRRKLMETLEVEVERAQRYGRPLSLIMVDLDNLKGINDTYGHAAGDEVIRIVSGAIQNHVRRVDLPTRIGGDEFLVLLPEADLEMATLVANRVCTQIINSPYQSTKISVSIGIGQWRDEFDSVTGFLHAVDKTLYQAKRAGGMQIYVSHPDGALLPSNDCEESKP
jgi:diguanylate cyclase (GGDEF)-like protein